jgi:hypothetical protein
MIQAEGQALTRQPGNMSAGVGPSQGVAGEVFCGFAIAGVSAAPFVEGYEGKVEEFVVPSNGTVKLSCVPVAGQVSAFDVTAGAVDADAAVAGQNVSGLTAGNTVKVTYKTAMSAVQARALMGDAQPGGYSGLVVGMVGTLKRGTVYTSEFDASVNWAAVTAIKVGAAGMLTDDGNGPAIEGFVVHVPTADVPFLGVEFTAP